MKQVAAQPIEIEAKFAASGAGAFERLSREPSMLPGYVLGEAVSAHVVDTYWDTADYRLLRLGYQLRVRAVEDHLVATVKTRAVGDAVGIFRRLEIEEPILDGTQPRRLKELPTPIAEALDGILPRAADLRPLCALDQLRTTRPVTADLAGESPAANRLLARLSLDETSIRQQGDGPVLARNYEIEVELDPGVDEAELQVLADRFQTGLQLLPSAESKLERALRVLSRHPAQSPENWQGLQPAMHMGEACRLIWQEQLMAMLLNEAGVRYAVDPEYVHRMRVAIRRARAAARLYGSFLKPKAVRSILKRLRKTASLLGEVRDLDVAIAKLERFGRKGKKQATGKLADLQSEWLVRRGTAHTQLVAWFDSDDYAGFVADFAAFCAATGTGLVETTLTDEGEAVPFQVRHVTPSMIVNSFEQVRSYEVLFEAAEAPPVASLHRLRIACKYLRYNLEFVADLLGPDSAALVDRLRLLQDRLGDLNDAVVSKQLVADGEADSGLERYVQAQDKIIADLRHELHTAHATFVGEESRRLLLTAVAAL